jgi:hypothetical protein
MLLRFQGSSGFSNSDSEASPGLYPLGVEAGVFPPCIFGH